MPGSRSVRTVCETVPSSPYLQQKRESRDGCGLPRVWHPGPARSGSGAAAFESLPDALLTAEGDEIGVERAALVDEITDDLAAIDSLETLEDVRAEIRWQRRRSL